MSKYLYGSYVAIGDSLTEGLGDFDFEVSRFGSGWADRLAELLGRTAHEAGENFDFANLALRGTNMLQILTAQLEDALALKPDLVTIMAGANDFMRSKKHHPALRALLRGAIERLLAQGCHVVVANTVNPIHLRVFRPLSHRARAMTELINSVAAEHEVPVLNVYDMDEFAHLEFWCADRVHFSGHGHIRVANRAAKLLSLDHGFDELHKTEMARPDTGFWGSLVWIQAHVMPFIGRRIRGTTSGDGLEAKHSAYLRLNFSRSISTGKASEERITKPITNASTF
ncbi:MAG: hypothetical protein RLZZ90_837 [Actinomycetota bacterium]